MSLRYRLLLVLLSAVTIAIVIATGATYLWARHEIDQLLDYHLRQQALALRDKATMLGTVVVPEPDPDQDFVIQAWNWRGQRVYLSHRGVELPRSAALGYADITAGGRDWRVYAMTLGAHLVQIAQPLQLRRALATQAALKILLPLLAVLPVLAVLVWWSVGRVLAPLGQLARSIGAREATRLSPLATTGLPAEARLMVDALNALIARLQQVLSRQREFIADAAHELRTPLTALKLQTQLLARAATPADRTDAIAELEAGVRRSALLVERLLAYARLDADQDGGARERLDFAALVRQCLREQETQVATRGLDLHVSLPDVAMLDGNLAGLHSLVSNLLDNALRYTPPPGAIAVDLGREDDAWVLRVTDTGPGIPPADRARVFDRFYRVPGSSAEGSGLGLAIAKRVADMHHGTLSVDTGPGGRGACFVLRLPAPAGPEGTTQIRTVLSSG